VVDPHRPTAAVEDLWEKQHYGPEQERKAAESEACQQLDKLRAQALEQDAIQETRISREPVRTSPRDGFYWQDRLLRG